MVTAKLVSDLLREVRSGSIDVVLMDDEIEGVKACDLVPVLKKINGIIQVIVISSGRVVVFREATSRGGDLLSGHETRGYGGAEIGGGMRPG